MRRRPARRRLKPNYENLLLAKAYRSATDRRFRVYDQDVYN